MWEFMPQQTISAPTCEEDETGEGTLLIEVFVWIDLHPVQQGFFFLIFYILYSYPYLLLDFIIK